MFILDVWWLWMLVMLFFSSHDNGQSVYVILLLPDWSPSHIAKMLYWHVQQNQAPWFYFSPVIQVKPFTICQWENLALSLVLKYTGKFLFSNEMKHYRVCSRVPRIQENPLFFFWVAFSFYLVLSFFLIEMILPDHDYQLFTSNLLPFHQLVTV